jgi:hypothetical protein
MILKNGKTYFLSAIWKNNPKIVKAIYVKEIIK